MGAGLDKEVHLCPLLPFAFRGCGGRQRDKSWGLLADEVACRRVQGGGAGSCSTTHVGRRARCPMPRCQVIVQARLGPRHQLAVRSRRTVVRGQDGTGRQGRIGRGGGWGGEVGPGKGLRRGWLADEWGAEGCKGAGGRGGELQHHARGTHGTVPQCVRAVCKLCKHSLRPRHAACCAV